MSDQDQGYSEGDIQNLVRRASEIQQDKGIGGRTDLNSVSKTSLQAACAELGIDQASIEQAIQEKDATPTVKVKTSAIWGGPLKIDIDTTVKGTITAEDWPALVAELNSVTSRGQVKQEGLFEWRHRDLATDVLVAPNKGRTRIQVTSKNGEAAIHFFGIWVAFFVGFIASGTLGLNIPAFLITLFAWYLGSRYLTTLIGRGRKKVAFLIAKTIKDFIESQPE